MLASQSLTHPPSSFHRSLSNSSSSDPPSHNRGGSEATLTTIYSMYGDSARSTSSSSAPTSYQSVPLPEASFDHNRHSTISSESSDLPYAGVSEDPVPQHVQSLNGRVGSQRASSASALHSQSIPENHDVSFGSPETGSRPPSHETSSKALPPNPIELTADEQSVVVEAPASALGKGLPVEPTSPDAQFVRTTYAQLDVFGVPGDGWKDGVELTRARPNPSELAEISNSPVATLTRAELDALSQLDRYGFYASSTGERRVALPTARPLSVFRASRSDVSPSVRPFEGSKEVEPLPKEQERSLKWRRMLCQSPKNPGSWEVEAGKLHKLRKRVYKGIPDCWRLAAWDLLTRERSPPPQSNYNELLDVESEYDIQIDLDVPRTISGHILFRTRYGLGQRNLFHVLHAFSLYCSSCGYCQGMGPPAATFLCYATAEKAYEWMCRLHDRYQMHSIYSPGFPGLLENIYVQERLMERYVPGVYEALKQNMISTTSYATKWYITLFANTVPFQMQLRLWDAFLLDGLDVLVTMAVYVLWAFKENLISKTANFETILSLLSSDLIPEKEDAVMEWIYRVLKDSNLRRDMGDWRKEWRGLVAKGEGASRLL